MRNQRPNNAIKSLAAFAVGGLWFSGFLISAVMVGAWAGIAAQTFNLFVECK